MDKFTGHLIGEDTQREKMAVEQEYPMLILSNDKITINTPEINLTTDRQAPQLKGEKRPHQRSRKCGNVF